MKFTHKNGESEQGSTSAVRAHLHAQPCLGRATFLRAKPYLHRGQSLPILKMTGLKRLHAYSRLSEKHNGPSGTHKTNNDMVDKAKHNVSTSYEKGRQFASSRHIQPQPFRVTGTIHDAPFKSRQSLPQRQLQSSTQMLCALRFRKGHPRASPPPPAATPDNANRRQMLLDAIFTDTTVLINPADPRGRSYFHLLVDAAIGLMRGTPLPNKLTATKTILRQIKTLQNQLGTTVERYQSENALQLQQTSLKDVVQSQGKIVMNMVLHSSEQNGLVERDLRTVVNAVGTVLEHTQQEKRTGCTPRRIQWKNPTTCPRDERQERTDPSNTLFSRKVPLRLHFYRSASQETL